jgi:hypothetical protein
MNQTAIIDPPKTHNMSPFELMAEHINDLYAEAAQWLDGEPVTTQQQADALNTLENRIREAAKDCEVMRKEEVKPLDEAKAEIQERYNPLIGKTTKVTGKTVAAIDAVKAALKPYLLELDRQQREAAEASRKEAEAKQAAAMEAMRSRDAANLDQAEAAEKLVQEAKAAEAEAARAEKAKAHAKGDGRASGLRSVWKATITDEKAAAGWMWTDHRAELMAFVQEYADKATRAGKRTIPGFSIIETKEL